VVLSGDSKGGPRGRAPLADYWPLCCPPPHQITALSGLAQLKLWNYTCLFALEFAQALKTVIEELVNGESAIVTDISEAQITCKLSRR